LFGFSAILNEKRFISDGAVWYATDYAVRPASRDSRFRRDAARRWL